MKNKLVLSCILSALAGLPTVRGQSITPSVINNAGGSGTIAGNTYEWSVGEIMVSTFTSSSVIVTQGVLQPNAASTEVPTLTTLSGISVFPNPSSSIVNIQFDARQEGVLGYRLMDVTGRVIMGNSSHVKIGAVARILDIRHLANANYMLQISYAANGMPEEVNTWKLQKLN